MFLDDYDDENGGSNLISEIFSSATQLGTAAILSNSQPSTLSPYPAPRASNPFLPNSYNSTTGTMMTFIVVAVLAIVGIFVFKKL